MNELRLLVLPGDGVGPEVTAQSVRVLDWFRDRRKLGAHMLERPFGRAAWNASRSLMPDEATRLEHAVAAALAGGARTQDIAAPGEAVGNTVQMGDAVLAALEASR